MAIQVTKQDRLERALTSEFRKRASLLAFAKEVSFFERGRHHEYIGERLQDLAVSASRREGGKLLVETPPGHGKSTLCSQIFPAWFLGNWPGKGVILLSYSANVALGFSRKARDLLKRSGPDVFGVEINPDAAAKSEWETESGGGLSAAGIGGSVTGKRADLLIIDDPHKDEEAVATSQKREQVWHTYTQVVRTRLNPGAAQLLIQTRWHKQDLAGMLLDPPTEVPEDLQEYVRDWEEIRLPALSEGERDDPLDREEGEPLWPDFWPRSELLAAKADVDEFTWASLYQQRPRPRGGSLYQDSYFRHYEGSPREAWDEGKIQPLDGSKGFNLDRSVVFLSVDPASAADEQSSYFAIAVWAGTPQRLALIDVLRDRVEGPDRAPQIMRLYREWNASEVVVESNQDKDLIQRLTRKEVPVTPVNPSRDKWERALPAAAEFKKGNVLTPERSRWLKDYLNELLDFPRGDYDDQVDVTSSGVQYWLDEIARRGGPGEVRTRSRSNGASVIDKL